jgi:ABC-2 type transport system ATP-binding protein
MALVLELAAVSHWYGSFRALTEVDLRLEAGPIGLVGQNGAGKSTLMQILLGLIRPTQGQARVLGLDARTAGMRLRSRVGYMPDRNALIPGLNGIEYVALAGEMCGMPRRQALRRAHETLSHLGLEDARYRRLDQYSLGMSQRLKLAATLVHDPDLLLLDEPTSGLDPEGRAAMLNLLGTLARRPGKSLLLASHLLGDIERVCGSAIILDKGRVLSVGRIETLRAARQRGYRLRWDGVGGPFLDTLRRHGVRIEAHRDLVRELPGEPTGGANGGGLNSGGLNSGGLNSGGAIGPVVGGEARVIVPAEWRTREFFAAAVAQGVTLQMLSAEEEDLDAVYHRLIGGVSDRQAAFAAPAGADARAASVDVRAASVDARAAGEAR